MALIHVISWKTNQTKHCRAAIYSHDFLFNLIHFFLQFKIFYAHQWSCSFMRRIDESKQANNDIKNWKWINKSVNKQSTIEFRNHERQVWPLIKLCASALKQINNQEYLCCQIYTKVQLKIAILTIYAILIN